MKLGGGAGFKTGRRIKLARPRSVAEEQGPPDQFFFERPCFKWRFGNDYVFDSGQEEVWDCIGKPMLADAYDGYNVTLFAYGQTIKAVPFLQCLIFSSSFLSISLFSLDHLGQSSTGLDGFTSFDTKNHRFPPRETVLSFEKRECCFKNLLIAFLCRSSMSFSFFRKVLEDLGGIWSRGDSVE